MALPGTARATFPGENGNIAYTYAGDLRTIDARGRVTTRIVPHSYWNGSLQSAHDPSFSADGSQIVYACQQEGHPQICRVDADGSNQAVLTAGIPGSTSPAFSPDGTIVFQRYATGNDLDIFAMDTDGTNVRNLTNSVEAETDPAVSPDGAHIAFTRRDRSGAPGQSDIYVMNAAGTDVTNLTNTPDGFSERSPRYSPDGTRIIFVGGHGIYSMSTAGDDRRLLTSSDEGDVQGVISPDGTRLAFLRTFEISCDGEFEPCLYDTNLLRSDADGANPRVLVHDDLYYFHGIDWGPRTALPPSDCHGLEATIVGTDNPDGITGTKRDDVIAALGGHDRVNGRGGNDVICGGSGEDRLRGGPGNDELFGGADDEPDVLYGGRGRDVCHAGKGGTERGCDR
jgi:Tol biopolymer transport system component